MQQFVTLRQMVEHFGLEVSPRTPISGNRFLVRCPFCAREGRRVEYKMNCVVDKRVYRCPVCGSSGSVLDLYAHLAQGTDYIRGSTGNGRDLAGKLRADFHLERGHKAVQAPYPAREPPPAGDIPRAADAAVSAVYGALLSLPCLALNSTHRENLLRRGFSEQAIRQGGYRSFSLPEALTLVPASWRQAREQLEREKKDSVYHHLLDATRPEQLLAGLAIAEKLTRQGLDLAGVPGFFRFRGRWCFRFEEGMAIPTRNENGETVALQWRRDRGKLRYLTLSSSGLPEGVTVSVSRIHFPLGNAPLSPESHILLTEGPLKADLILDMLRTDFGRADIALVALPGVNNTAALPAVLAGLQKAGVRTVENALDMDKLTKITVLNASRKIRAMVRSAGLACHTLLWDERTAREKLARWQALCRENHLEVPDQGSIPFIRLGVLTRLLAENRISLSREQSAWEPATNGMDDMLLTLRKSRAGRGIS